MSIEIQMNTFIVINLFKSKKILQVYNKFLTGKLLDFNKFSQILTILTGKLFNFWYPSKIKPYRDFQS